ncbi:hypothetical protein JCM16303_006309 [Sporobolomyces ruberrimus]
MVTRPFTEYEHFITPLPSPPLNSKSVLDFPSINQDSLPFTPPPSLPTSSPGSPEYHNQKLYRSVGGQGARGSGSYKMTPLSDSPKSKVGTLGAPRRSYKAGIDARSSFTDHVEVSALPEGYGDESAPPILPKTKLSILSAVFSDDSTDELSGSGGRKKREKGTRAPRRRVVSQETVVTTTSTRKLERRKIRYSASLLDEMNDEAFQEFMSRNTLADYTQSRPLPEPSPQEPNPRTSSRSSRPRLRSVSKPRRSSVSHQRQNSSSRPPSSSTSTRPPSHSRRRKSVSVSKPSRLSNALVLHSDSSSSTLSSFTYDEFEPDYPLYHAPPFIDPSTRIFRPVVNLFTFLLVSSFCCMTVSAVLVASFSLTFYDDCGRRLSGLNRSLRAGARSIEGGIGGVKEGMEKMLGNAKGAIENAVKAAEGITTTDGEGRVGESAMGREGGGRDAKRTAMPTVTERDSGDEDEEQMGGKENTRTNSKSRPRPSSSSVAPRTQGWRFRSSPGRRGFNPFTAFTSSTAAPSSPEEHNKGGWATDEDALPFDVPHSTPHASRPASPHRTPRSRQPSSESTFSTASTSASALPPRPHLAVLLPSLVFAVILTLAKLGYSFWRASKERQEQRDRARFDDEWRRRHSRR